MANSGMGGAETARALELAEGYLEDAEHVLWVASAQTDSPARATDLEGSPGSSGGSNTRLRASETRCTASATRSRRRSISRGECPADGGRVD